jgi:hypothetical protein
VGSAKRARAAAGAAQQVSATPSVELRREATLARRAEEDHATKRGDAARRVLPNAAQCSTTWAWLYQYDVTRQTLRGARGLIGRACYVTSPLALPTIHSHSSHHCCLCWPVGGNEGD